MAEVRVWTAIAQLAQKRWMVTAVFALADPPLMLEACAKNVLRGEFRRLQVVPLANLVQLEPTKVVGNSATHVHQAKFPEKAVLVELSLLQDTVCVRAVSLGRFRREEA